MNGLNELKKKQHLEAQLRFRQLVLKQSHPSKDVYFVSRKGKKLTSCELSANLYKLIHAAPLSTVEDILKAPQKLVGHEIKHRFENDDGSLTWYDGLVIGFNDVEFEVIYYGEEDTCEFDLLSDFSKGDLQISH